MPGIFKNSVSTGQHNSKIFSQAALDLFKQISELKKGRMWSIAQIKNYLKSSQTSGNVKNNPRLNNIETDAGTFAYTNDKSCFKEVSNLSYNIPTQTLIEQIFALKEEIATLEKKNANLKNSLMAKEIETSAQRKMSDQIIFELTTHISKLSNSISKVGSRMDTGPLNEVCTGKLNNCEKEFDIDISNELDISTALLSNLEEKKINDKSVRPLRIGRRGDADHE